MVLLRWFGHVIRINEGDCSVFPRIDGKAARERPLVN